MHARRQQSKAIKQRHKREFVCILCFYRMWLGQVFYVFILIGGAGEDTALLSDKTAT